MRADEMRSPIHMRSVLSFLVLMATPGLLLAQDRQAPLPVPGSVAAIEFDTGTSPAPEAVPEAATDTWWEDDYVEGMTFSRTIAPATLITLGLFTFKDEGFLNRQDIKDWRNEFIPEFANHIDDMGQWVAGAFALGLNVAGVEGRHSLGRAAVTYGTSMGVMAIAVHSMKALTEVNRPHGGTHSFPSGHTAAAFASARFLDREYGQRSYLYSLGGYSVAAMTGVFRQLNNAHWLSDVLVGAGIGILSTDIAYAIVDEIYGEKGVNTLPAPAPPRPRGNPSFLDFRVGGASLTGDIEDPQGRFAVGEGWTAGFEGAWFFIPWLGVGGEWAVASFPIDNSGFIIEDPEVDEIVEEILTQPLGAESYYVGPFLNLPLGSRWALNGKLTAGLNAPATGKISVRIEDEFQDAVGAEEFPLYQYQGRETFGWAAGAALRWVVSESIGIRAFLEWNSSHPDYESRAVTGVNDDGSLILGPVVEQSDVDFSYVGFGVSVSALLW